MAFERGIVDPSVFRHSDFFMAIMELGQNTVSQLIGHYFIWSGRMCRTGQDGCDEIGLLSGAGFTVNGLDVIFNSVW